MTNVTTGELVLVDFYGDKLEAVKDDGGKIWVSLRRACENLDVSVEVQLKKLKSKPWATMMEKIMVAEDGKQRTVTVVDLETLPGWLFSIDARKVREELREKLARYQREAARVLADHFYGRTVDAHSVHHQPINLTREEIRTMFIEFVRQLPAGSLATPVSAMPRYTIRERLRYLGRLPLTAASRRKIRRLAASLLLMKHNETPDVSDTSGGGATLWYGHQLVVLDEAIDRYFEEERQREAARGPGIFDSYRG